MRNILAAMGVVLMAGQAMANERCQAPYSPVFSDHIVTLMDDPSTNSRCQTEGVFFRCIILVEGDTAVAEWRVNHETQETKLCDFIMLNSELEMFDWHE